MLVLFAGGTHRARGFKYFFGRGRDVGCNVIGGGDVFSRRVVGVVFAELHSAVLVQNTDFVFPNSSGRAADPVAQLGSTWADEYDAVVFTAEAANAREDDQAKKK